MLEDFNETVTGEMRSQKEEFLYFQKQPPKVLYKKMVLKIWQNSQKSTCDRVSFLIKLQASVCHLI